MATIQEAMAIAIRHHQDGRLQEAERIYRQKQAEWKEWFARLQVTLWG